MTEGCQKPFTSVVRRLLFCTSPDCISVNYELKRSKPWSNRVDVILSDDSSSSSDADDDGSGSKKSNNNVSIDQPVEKENSEGLMIKKAQTYQDYMKQIPVPIQRGSVIPFTSWTGLAKSIKLLHGQPLHYLTNILLKQWDKIRIAGDNEDGPLDIAIHPCKAEASIWLIEKVHRPTTSPHHLAKLWLSDPMPHVYIDPIFPEL